MSELALTVIKVLFLALLWLFIVSAVSVIRSDLFGRTVPMPDQPGAQELEQPLPPPKKTEAYAGRAPGPDDHAGQSGRPVGRAGRRGDPDRPRLRRQLILDDDYVSTRHARLVSGENGVYRGGPRLDQRQLRQQPADHRSDHDHAFRHRTHRPDRHEAGAVSRDVAAALRSPFRGRPGPQEQPGLRVRQPAPAGGGRRDGWRGGRRPGLGGRHRHGAARRSGHGRHADARGARPGGQRGERPDRRPGRRRPRPGRHGHHADRRAVRRQRLGLAHIGDSRAYRLRDGRSSG